MPPENVLTSRSASSARLEPLEQLVGAPPRGGAGQVVEPADQLEVRAGGQQPVDGRRLGGEADPRAHARRRRPTTSRPATRARPLVGQRERGEDAHGGRLAGAVVAEQPEHRAGGDVEVEVAQRPEVAEALAEALGGDPAEFFVRCMSMFVHRTTKLSSTLYEMSRRPR